MTKVSPECRWNIENSTRVKAETKLEAQKQEFSHLLFQFLIFFFHVKSCVQFLQIMNFIVKTIEKNNGVLCQNPEKPEISPLGFKLYWSSCI